MKRSSIYVAVSLLHCVLFTNKQVKIECEGDFYSGSRLLKIIKHECEEHKASLDRNMESEWESKKQEAVPNTLAEVEKHTLLYFTS